MSTHTIVHGNTTVLLVPLDETAARASLVNPYDNPTLFVLLGRHPRPSFIAMGQWLCLQNPHVDIATMIHKRFELDLDTAMRLAVKAVAVLPKPYRE